MHKGFKGSEPINLLAKEAVATMDVGRQDAFFAVGPHTIREERASRSRYWLQKTGLRHAKLFLRRYNTKRFKQLIVFTRDKLRQLVAIYMSHCRLGVICTKFFSQCRFCELAMETSGHMKRI